MSGLAPSDENKHQPVLLLGLVLCFIVMALLVLSLVGLPVPMQEEQSEHPIPTDTQQSTRPPAALPSSTASLEPTLPATATFGPPMATAMPPETSSPTPWPSPQPSTTPTDSPSPTPTTTQTPTLHLQRPTRVRRTTPNP